MSNQVVTQQSFQERMMDRIRSSMGELMTEEELKKVVEKALNEAFFKGYEVQINKYNTKVEPPLIHKLIKELLTEQIKTLLIEYMKVHKVEINQMIDKTVQEGLGLAFMRAISSMFKGTLNNFKYNIEQSINSGSF